MGPWEAMGPILHEFLRYFTWKPAQMNKAAKIVYKENAVEGEYPWRGLFRGTKIWGTGKGGSFQVLPLLCFFDKMRKVSSWRHTSLLPFYSENSANPKRLHGVCVAWPNKVKIGICFFQTTSWVSRPLALRKRVIVNIVHLWLLVIKKLVLPQRKEAQRPTVQI